MGDGISDLVMRGEASDAECEAAVRQYLQDADEFTWWPGGRHHSAICRMKSRGELELADISTSQETRFLVRRGPKF